MILDDLFSKAATDNKGGVQISVQAMVTKNQTGGITSKANNGSTEGPVALQYHPEQGLVVPASFSSANPPIKITGSIISVVGQDPYVVEILGHSFAPAVDAKTQIVYGAAGAVFVTISLCGYLVMQVPK